MGMRGRNRWLIAFASLALISAIPVTNVVAGSSGAAGPPDAVLAVVDTGINPYHETFRDDSSRAFQHPSTYIPGYPADAEALHLTFGPDYWESVKADCERVWSNVLDEKLYWIPGTRIVGAITFDLAGGLDCDRNKPSSYGIILDSQGHGTMTASRAVSKDYGGCPGCLVVAVEGLNIAAIEWAAENASWVDAQSNSWAPLPVWEPTGFAGSDTRFVRAVEATSATHLAFWSSGNGAARKGGVLGHPTAVDPHHTPSAIIVGGHDSGYVTTWPGFSAHVVSDACAAWAAHHDHASRSGDRVSGGTSGATPFAAGIALETLRTARSILGSAGTGVHNGVVARGPAGLVKQGPLADGVFTLDEWKRVVFVTATPRPARQREDGPPCGALEAPHNETPVRWVDIPPQYPEYVQIGYGASDRPAQRLATQVLRGEIPAPDRARTDSYFAVDHQVRTLTYGVFSKP